MNWEQIEGKWDTVKGQIEEKWGKLTEDDLTGNHSRYFPKPWIVLPEITLFLCIYISSDVPYTWEWHLSR